MERTNNYPAPTRWLPTTIVPWSLHTAKARQCHLNGRRLPLAHAGVWTETNHCWDTKRHPAYARQAQSKPAQLYWSCAIPPRSYWSSKRFQPERVAIDATRLGMRNAHSPHRYSNLHPVRARPVRSTRLPYTL